MKTLKPAIVLVIIATIVPELLTGSTPLSGFFNIFTVIILFLGYGVAVLLVREFAVRNNLSYGGIFILGFAYSILNEGLLAKTMILNSGLPISPQFDNYGYFLGISWAWAALIMMWHAVCSVLFPIFAVHALFSQESKRPWLNKKFAIFSSFVISLLGVLFFFGNFKITGTPAQLLILLIMMFSIIMLAKKIGSKNPATQSVEPLNSKPVWLGLSTFFFFTVALSAIAGKKLPLLLFFIVYALGIFIYIRILKAKLWMNRENLFLFAIGCYMQTALLGMILAIFMPAGVIPGTLIERLSTGIIAEILLIFIANRIIRKSKTLSVKMA